MYATTHGKAGEGAGDLTEVEVEVVASSRYMIRQKKNARKWYNIDICIIKNKYTQNGALRAAAAERLPSAYK